MEATAAVVVPPVLSKWYKTVKCGCGECRFKDTATRGECPKINEPGAIWLWALNSDFIGIKDYVDPLDFATPVPEAAAAGSVEVVLPPATS